LDQSDQIFNEIWEVPKAPSSTPCKLVIFGQVKNNWGNFFFVFQTVFVSYGLNIMYIMMPKKKLILHE